MPRIHDVAAIRTILETDRPWAVYALGDLAPHRLPHCTWLSTSGSEPAIVLVYREFPTPILLTVGPAHAVRPLLEEIGDVPQMFIHLRPEIVDLLRPHYRIEDESDMWRMPLDPARFPSVPTEGAVALGPADVPALQQLYTDGEPSGELPHFFFPSMLEDGVFCGIWEGQELIAAAGTHFVVPTAGVAAVGNIYTRRDRRGRGLATRVTAAVTAELLRRNLRTIALNVNQQNESAIRVYERLGYARYCAFKEGLAIRKPQAARGPDSQFSISSGNHLFLR